MSPFRHYVIWRKHPVNRFLQRRHCLCGWSSKWVGGNAQTFVELDHPFHLQLTESRTDLTPVEA